MQFFGQHDTKLDEKNRVVFPARFKAQFGTEPAYLTAGPRACITVYTDETYKERAEKVMVKYDDDDAENAEQRTLFFSRTEQAGVDTQGRVTIPPRLRSHAGLDTNGPVLLIGGGPSFEIWNPAAYERRNET